MEGATTFALAGGFQEEPAFPSIPSSQENPEGGANKLAQKPVQ